MDTTAAALTEQALRDTTPEGLVSTFATLTDQAHEGLDVAALRHRVQAEMLRRMTEPADLVSDAYDLLRDARSSMADPALTRSWGQRRRRFADRVIGLGLNRSMP